MPEVKQYVFSHKEIAEMCIKRLDIHDGLWGTYFEFSLRGANAGPSDDQITPSALVGVTKVGIQKFDSESNITVDASKVNPAKPKKSGGSKKGK